MSQILIDKIKKARELLVVANGLQFTVRRPDDLEVIEMRGKGISQRDILKRFVIGWVDVREMDLIPGGTPKPVEFDADLFIEWVADQPEVFITLIDCILTAYKSHEQEREDALKKPDTGSN